MTKQELDVVRDAIVAGVKAGLEAVVINPNPEPKPSGFVAMTPKPENPLLAAATPKIEMAVRSVLSRIQGER